MIKDNNETAISLGGVIDLEYNKVISQSVLKSASFKVALVNEEGAIRTSHNEPINVLYLSDERKGDIKLIEEAMRRIWEDMKNPAEYYDRSE